MRDSYVNSWVHPLQSIPFYPPDNIFQLVPRPVYGDSLINPDTEILGLDLPQSGGIYWLGFLRGLTALFSKSVSLSDMERLRRVCRSVYASICHLSNYSSQIRIKLKNQFSHVTGCITIRTTKYLTGLRLNVLLSVGR